MSLSLRSCLSLAFLVPLFFGCEKDDALDDLPLFPQNAQLKQVTSFIPGSAEGLVIEVYEYDDEGRVLKISTPKPNGSGASDYKDYTYNSEGQLAKIAHYYFNINVDEYVNLQNTTFSWSAAGLKTKEEIENTETAQSEVHEFIYDGNRLIRTNRYGSNDELVSYSLYEYDANGKIVKASDLSSDKEVLSYKTFAYSNDLLVRAVSYDGRTDEPIREEKYVYDKNKNLVIMHSIVKASWISSTSYELHYEYFNSSR